MNAETNADARLGQHIASFAANAGPQFDLLAPTFSSALSQDCRGLFIADRTPPDAFAKGLADRGCDIEPALKTGQFVLLTADETYIKGGYFDPDRQLALWEEAMASARKDGFAGLVASGEITWLDRGAPGVDRWLEYEYLMNLIEERDVVGLVCLYREGSLPEWAEAELLNNHPFVHRNGKVEANESFQAGEEGLADVPLMEDMEPPADRVPCALLAPLLSAYADRELHPRRRAELAGHLECCPKCAAAARGHTQLKGALAGLHTSATTPEGFWDEVRRQWATDRPEQS